GSARLASQRGGSRLWRHEYRACWHDATLLQHERRRPVAHIIVRARVRRLDATNSPAQKLLPVSRPGRAVRFRAESRIAKQPSPTPEGCPVTATDKAAHTENNHSKHHNGGNCATP